MNITTHIFRIANRHPKFQKFLVKLSESMITGIVFAIIASLLTTLIVECREQKKSIKAQINNISNIYIGCNKAWADECFGTPEFSYKTDKNLLCAYVSEYYVIQIAFDLNHSAQAYLITALDNNNRTTIEIQDKTIFRDEHLTLGKFSFYNYPDAPNSVFGYVTNGTGRSLYSETYYANGGGAYYAYHIASLDFGVGAEALKFDVFSDGTVIDDEVTSDKNLGVQIISNRKTSCPNSYGVSIDSFNMEDTLFSYHWFNSQQLRNKYRR